MAETENTAQRSRSDSNNRPDPWQLTNMSDFSASESATDLIEVMSPPLVIISSRVKSATTLANCVNPGVAVVKYSYEATSLAKLLQQVGEKLKGRRALSVALLMHGQPGYFKICSGKVREVDLSVGYTKLVSR